MPQIHKASLSDLAQVQDCAVSAYQMYVERIGRKPAPMVADFAALIEAEAKRLGVERRDITPEEIVDRCICGLITEGARILEDGIATRASDIDVIWTNGYGFPRYRGGPMHYADAAGLPVILDKVLAFRDRLGAEYWEPPALLEKLAKDGGTFAGLDAG